MASRSVMVDDASMMGACMRACYSPHAVWCSVCCEDTELFISLLDIASPVCERVRTTAYIFRCDTPMRPLLPNSLSSFSIDQVDLVPAPPLQDLWVAAS